MFVYDFELVSREIQADSDGPRKIPIAHTLQTQNYWKRSDLPRPYPWLCLAKLLTTASTASLSTVLVLKSLRTLLLFRAPDDAWPWLDVPVLLSLCWPLLLLLLLLLLMALLLLFPLLVAAAAAADVAAAAAAAAAAAVGLPLA